MAQAATLISTVSAASSANSATLFLGDLISGNIQVVFSGSDVIGALQLQVSNDGTNFVSVGASTAVTASANKNFDLGLLAPGCCNARVVWTYTSGTGNITVSSWLKEPPKTA